MRAPRDVSKQTQTVTADVRNPAELLWNLIIRPPRSKYTKDQLGPTYFRLGKHCYVRRTDVQLRNPRGHLLQGSLFETLPRGIWEQSRTVATSSKSHAADSSNEGPPGSLESEGAAHKCAGREADSPRGVAPVAAEAVAAAAAAAAAAGMSSPKRPCSPLRTVGAGVGLGGPRGDGLGACARSSSRSRSNLPGSLRSDVGGAGVCPGSWGPPEPMPCVVFLHGNSSCCLEALPLLTLLSPLSISLFCFDFSGCGLSEGEYISLGWFERDDLATCIDYLRSTGRISTIALWGRSMGAFTALLHADRDPSIAGLVLDSPFISLSVLAEELARGYAKVPAWMARAVLVMVRSMIQSKAHFDIEGLEAFQHVRESFQPALFVAAHGDDFIYPHHAQKLYEAYQGEKELRMVDGDHNSVRPEAFRREAVLFLCRAFHSERLNRLLKMHTSGLYDIFAVSHRLPGLSSDSRGSGEDGALIMQTMQVFPALRSMRLFHKKKCHRPLTARVSMKLQQEHAEAGLFVAFDPQGGTGLSTPRFLLLSVSSEALVLSRVLADSVESIAASTGLQVRQSRQLVFEIDRDGNLRAQLGTDAPVECSFGKGYREQVTIWLMVVHGQTSFGPLIAEDGEATLRESLGDAVLYHRHLGPHALGPGKPPPSKPLPSLSMDTGLHGPGIARMPGRGVLPTDGPVAMPGGDMGIHSPKGSPCASQAALLWAEELPLPRAMTDPTSAGHCAALATEEGIFCDSFSDGAQNLAALAQSECAIVADLCATKPEALIGWRVHVDSIGEGLVVGIKRRLGRSTKHVVSWADGIKCKTPPLVFQCKSRRSDDVATAIVLQRKERHKRRCRGHSFEVLNRVF